VKTDKEAGKMLKLVDKEMSIESMKESNVVYLYAKCGFNIEYIIDVIKTYRIDSNFEVPEDVRREALGLNDPLGVCESISIDLKGFSELFHDIMDMDEGIFGDEDDDEELE